MYKEFIFIYVALIVLLVAMVAQFALLIVILLKVKNMRGRENRMPVSMAPQNYGRPSVVFCSTCATQYDGAERFCPKCGTPRM